MNLLYRFLRTMAVMLGLLAAQAPAQPSDDISPGSPVPRPRLWGYGEDALREALVPMEPEDMPSREAAAFWEGFMDEVDHERLMEINGTILGEIIASQPNRCAWPEDPEIAQRAEEVVLEAREICQEIAAIFRTTDVPSPYALCPRRGLIYPVFRCDEPGTPLPLFFTLQHFGKWPQFELALADSTGDPSPVIGSLRGLHAVVRQMRAWSEPDLVDVIILSSIESRLMSCTADLVAEFDLGDETLADLDQMLASLEGPLPFPEGRFHHIERWLTGWLASEESRQGMVASLTADGVRIRMDQATEGYVALWGNEPPSSAEMVSAEWFAFANWIRPHYAAAARNPAAFQAEVDRLLRFVHADWEDAFADPAGYTRDWELEEQTSNPLIWQANPADSDQLESLAGAADRLAGVETNRLLARTLIALKRGDAEAAAQFIDPFTGDPLIVGADHIRSVGFDRIDQFGEVRYDPTNGIGSGGDIVVGRGPIPLPPFPLSRTPPPIPSQPDGLYGGPAAQSFSGAASPNQFVSYPPLHADPASGPQTAKIGFVDEFGRTPSGAFFTSEPGSPTFYGGQPELYYEGERSTYFSDDAVK